MDLTGLDCEGYIVAGNHTRISLGDAAQARQLGIGMVLQHCSLFERLTVAQNIALSLGKEQTGKLKTLARRISEIGAHYDIPVVPQQLVRHLSTGERQWVEILRCLIQNGECKAMGCPSHQILPWSG
jgi:simple sugar transport system ATP-binding protein